MKSNKNKFIYGIVTYYYTHKKEEISAGYIYKYNNINELATNLEKAIILDNNYTYCYKKNCKYKCNSDIIHIIAYKYHRYLKFDHKNPDVIKKIRYNSCCWIDLGLNKNNTLKILGHGNNDNNDNDGNNNIFSHIFDLLYPIKRESELLKELLELENRIRNKSFQQLKSYVEYYNFDINAKKYWLKKSLENDIILLESKRLIQKQRNKLGGYSHKRSF